MSDVPGPVEGWAESSETTIAGYDQGQAEALDALRQTKAFVLFTFQEVDGERFGIRHRSLVPMGPQARAIRLGFIDTLETVLAELKEEEGL